MNSCSSDKKVFCNFKKYPTPTEVDLWLNYSKEYTEFKIWSPSAETVRLSFYEKGNGGKAFKTYSLENDELGVWSKVVSGNLQGTYYTFQIKIGKKWLNETPGIYAQGVGVNGQRAMVLDLESTNPAGWNSDKGPEIKYTNEAIIYELHIRDMTIHPQSGSSMPGKYLGLVEENTKGSKGHATGIDHLKEMGITHVHLLPAFDHHSIDEENLDSDQFNWGYDPQNYNVPEGSFSLDPFNAEVRIREFKKMVKKFHENEIGVILDVVYNHTGKTEESNFNQEVPNYYYRFKKDGSYSDAAACGNETASERAMMRKFIIESVSFWAKEYHIDGFRFDLMGIHDIETMNEVSKTLKKINANIFIYGEGWTAGDSPLPEEKRALKKHMQRMPEITAFSDDIRDGLKGSVFEDGDTGYASGKTGMEESIKFGVVGSIQHPQINYEKVNYSETPWTDNPWQAISYVSCHDNHTLYDKLKISRPDASEADIIAMDKLANAIVMTSQGTAFLHAGAEMLRTKNGEYNSYNLPDNINQIDWNRKVDYPKVMEYYKNLIALRKAHPAFRMASSEDVRKNLKFKKEENGLLAYEITNNANGDIWKTILVIYNARTKIVKYNLDDTWQLAVSENVFYSEESESVKEAVRVPPISMTILFKN